MFSSRHDAPARYGLMMAFVTALLWSVLPIFLKIASNTFSPIFIVWCRFSVACIGTFVLLQFRGRNPVRIFARPPKRALLAGLALAANYYGFTRGVELSGATTAALLIQSGGLSLTVFGVFIFGEKLTALQFFGFLLAVVGLCFFFFDRSGTAIDLAAHRWGSGVTLLAGLMWGIYASLIKGNTGRLSSHEINLLVFTIGTLVFMPMLQSADFQKLTFPYLLLMLALGINTLLAYASLAESLRYAPAAQTSIVISINPLFTLAIAAFFTGLGLDFIAPEPVSALGYTGALLTVAGVVCVLRKNKPGAALGNPAEA